MDWLGTAKLALGFSPAHDDGQSARAYAKTIGSQNTLTAQHAELAVLEESSDSFTILQNLGNSQETWQLKC